MNIFDHTAFARAENLSEKNFCVGLKSNAAASHSLGQCGALAR
jgi:hypothetical protein